MFQDIATGRLILRGLQPADAETIFQYRWDPGVSRFQSWKPSPVDQLRTTVGWRQIGIALRSTGELIGDCGIHLLDDPRLAEIGITLAPGFQFHGYATEALRAVFDYLFGDLQVHRVSASVDPSNVRSIRLMQRLGLRQEAHMIESLWFKGRWVDDVIFAMLAREWKGK